MRFATIKVNGTEKAGIVLKNGVLPIEALNAAKGTAWAEDVMSLIQKQQIRCHNGTHQQCNYLSLSTG